MNKIYFVLAVVFLSAFAYDADSLNEPIDASQRLVEALSSTNELRSVVFTPHKLPCGYVIEGHADVNLSSGGRISYVQTMTKMNQSLIVNIDVLHPATQYVCYTFRYDLVYSKKHQKFLPSVDAMSIPQSSHRCKVIDYTLEEAEKKVNQHVRLFESSTTFDSVSKKTYQGKEYTVYTVTVKEASGITHADVFVDNDKYIFAVNLTETAIRTTRAFTTYKYSFYYTLKDFAVDRKKFLACNDTMYIPPSHNSCEN